MIKEILEETNDIEVLEAMVTDVDHYIKKGKKAVKSITQGAGKEFLFSYKGALSDIAHRTGSTKLKAEITKEEKKVNLILKKIGELNPSLLDQITK